MPLVDALSCLYLSAPLAIFCAWLRWPVALGVGLLLAGGVRWALRPVDWRGTALAPRTLALLALLAAAWTAVLGVGHFTHANTDWFTRDAVLRDLTLTAWPPAYAAPGEFPLILRAPVGDYLPAALVGKVFGLQAADLAMFVWTAAGFALFLWGAASLFDSPRERRACVVVLLAFGGLDFVGFLLQNGRLPKLGQHLEAWAVFAQYSSNTTLLAWVPNHAIPAWLAVVVALRHWRTVTLARVAPLLVGTTLLWSPLATIGLLPFLLAGIDWRRDARDAFSLRSCFPFIGAALIVARYLTLDSSAIPAGWAWDGVPAAQFIRRDALFCLLEFGLLAVVVARLGARGAPFAVALAMLLVLPLLRFGIANDLVMRGSIPALTVVALQTVHPLVDDAAPAAWRAALVLLLVLGALGAAQEPIRSLIEPAWKPSGKSLGEVAAPGDCRADYTGLLPPHYAGRLNQPGLAALLREPTTVQPQATCAGAGR